MHAQMNFMTLSMRNIIILSILIFSGCLNSDSRPKSLSMIQKIIRIPQSLNIPMDSLALAKISFQELVINFDTIEEGTILEKEIGFFNRGSIPLVIGDVQSSCGCTAISYSTDFIQPDSSGTLLVRFNSRGWPLNQKKSIFVYANTIPNQTMLYLQGYVKPK